MVARAVVRYPAPILKQRAAEVEDPCAEQTRLLAADLVDTMRANPGCVGIAANQIGVLARICVVDVTGHRKARSCSGLLVLVNPVLVEQFGREVGREGCLSIPELTADVARPERLVCRASRIDGGRITVDADAFEARAIAHEIDHLDGILFLDRVVNHRRDVYRRKERGGQSGLQTPQG